MIHPTKPAPTIDIPFPAPCQNSLAKRKKGTGGTKAGLFFKLPYCSRFCCFIIAKFALRDGPAVAVLVETLSPNGKLRDLKKIDYSNPAACPATTSNPE